MNFEDTFLEWLDTSLQSPVEDKVKAFAFNLYETAGKGKAKFGIELIGAGQFDEADPDWPCAEVWEPETRGISIPLSYSGDNWKSCLAKMKALLARILNEQSELSAQLKTVEGIGIGFVDGDLEVAWKP